MEGTVRIEQRLWVEPDWVFLAAFYPVTPPALIRGRDHLRQNYTLPRIALGWLLTFWMSASAEARSYRLLAAVNVEGHVYNYSFDLPSPVQS